MEFNNLNQKDLEALTQVDQDLLIDLDKPDTDFGKPTSDMTLQEIKDALWWARLYGHTTVKLTRSRKVLEAELNRLKEQGVEFNKFFDLT